MRWLDASGEFIRAEGLWLPLLEAEWKQYRIHVTAPDQAATAQIVVAVTGSQTAWLDDICFAQGDGCP